VIPFARVFLNAEQSQDVVNQVNQEIKNGRTHERVKEYIDRGVARAWNDQSKDNANDGNNSRISNRGGDGGLDSDLLRKGRFFDHPRIYVKAKRADRFGLLDDNVYRYGDGVYTDDEVSFPKRPGIKNLRPINPHQKAT
jgi:hypothetical protein